MSVVFLDTVGLLALWDENDQWHAAAEHSFQALVAERAELVTSSYVLLETANAAARRPYRSAVVLLRERLEQTNRLIAPTAQDWETAWRGNERGEADNAGIVDHVSFAIMKRSGIQRVFSCDKHFRAAGFETLF